MYGWADKGILERSAGLVTVEPPSQDQLKHCQYPSRHTYRPPPPTNTHTHTLSLSFSLTTIVSMPGGITDTHKPHRHTTIVSMPGGMIDTHTHHYSLYARRNDTHIHTQQTHHNIF